MLLVIKFSKGTVHFLARPSHMRPLIHISHSIHIAARRQAPHQHAGRGQFSPSSSPRIRETPPAVALAAVVSGFHPAAACVFVYL